VSWRSLAAAAALAAALLAASMAAGRDPRPIHVGYRGQVFLADPHGGARRLTRGAHYDAEPFWSRDGRRIAVRTDDGIEVLSLAGTVKHRIPHPALSLAWSPDDEHIVYVRDIDPAPYRYAGSLVVSDLDGHGRTIVPGGVSDAVDWSPDGRTIYYKRGRPYADTDQSIWAVPSGGGEPRRVATGVYAGSRVLVSPNGARLLFERRGLWVARVAGGGEREVIGLSGYRGYGWLADGRVFGGLRSSDHRPVVATVAGKRRRLGVQMRTQRYDLAPGGKRIAWASVRDGEHSVVVIGARPDGSDHRVLARFTSKLFPEVDYLRWSPDGRHLAVMPRRHSGD
jgi:hypothetical protein